MQNSCLFWKKAIGQGTRGTGGSSFEEQKGTGCQQQTVMTLWHFNSCYARLWVVAISRIPIIAPLAFWEPRRLHHISVLWAPPVIKRREPVLECGDKFECSRGAESSPASYFYLHGKKGSKGPVPPSQPSAQIQLTFFLVYTSFLRTLRGPILLFSITLARWFPSGPDSRFLSIAE